MAKLFKVTDTVTGLCEDITLAPYPKVESGDTNISVQAVTQPDLQVCYRITGDFPPQPLQSMTFTTGSRLLSIVDSTGATLTAIIPQTVQGDGKYLTGAVVSSNCVVTYTMSDGATYSTDLSVCIDKIEEVVIDAGSVLRITTSGNVHSVPLPVSSMAAQGGGHVIATHSSGGVNTDVTETVTGIVIDPDTGVITYTDEAGATTDLPPLTGEQLVTAICASTAAVADLKACLGI